MPRISDFFGLAIYMYWFDTDKHKEPHFHVRYQGKEWVYSLNGVLLAGEKNTRIERLISDWCSLRKEELSQAWNKAIKGEALPWITPLN